MSESVAILNDDFRVHGGSQHVAVELARLFDAPIYNAYQDDSVVPDDVEAIEVFDGRKEQWLLNRHWFVQDMVQMFGWQHQPDLQQYDTIIVNKNNAGWYVPREDQTVVKYSHSTPRGLYDLWQDHQPSRKYTVLAPLMRALYRVNVTYPDAWACNSEIVQHRHEKYWDVSPEVVYPPVHTEEFGPDHAIVDRDAYLTVGRLDYNKRVEDMLEAVRGTDMRLIVAGDGPCRRELEASAPSNVEFRGFVSEAEKRQLLTECKAFIMNAKAEDFGMSPVEALASGTPVIGVREGYTQHQIADGVTGILYDHGVPNLHRALTRFERGGVTADEDDLQAAAERYDVAHFRARMRELVATAQDASTIEVTPPQPAADPDEQPEHPAVADGGVES